MAHAVLDACDLCRRYKNSLAGLCGNEDVGQMSAWYILASMGFHPLCPGETRYELTAPVFDRVEIALDRRYAKGRKFVVTTEGNAPDACYIQSATLNGKPLQPLLHRPRGYRPWR